MTEYRIKNWEEFQHFKDRTPPWVKLYRRLLDDLEWHQLSGDQAKCLVMLWLVASEDETKQGRLPSIDELTFRLRTTENKIMSLLAGLSHWLIQDDITMISERYQDDIPETETETETENPLVELNPKLDDQSSENSPIKGNPDLDAAELEGEPDPKDRANWKALFVFWQEQHGHQRAKFTKEREAKLRARLREGYSLDECAAAIRGVKRSKFHMGDNREGQRWDDWNLIFRSGAQLEKFRDLDLEGVKA